MSYTQKVLSQVEAKYSYQPEFLQAVREVFESLEPVITRNEKLYEEDAILERITEPDRQIQFRVPWVDDQGTPATAFSSTTRSVRTREV